MRRCRTLLTSVAVAASLLMAAMPSVDAANAYYTNDGSLRYAYGSRPEPLLKCQPLFICDITLESSESILNLAIGDSVRWVVATAQSGTGGTTPLVFVKPTELGLTTNLVITTTKRVYNIRLISAKTTASSRIAYWYPEEVAAAAQARAAEDKARQDERSSELPLLPPDKLDYAYAMTGAKDIMPSRVFNDGVHTFVQFATLPNDLPVVFGSAHDGSDQIVNSRLRGTQFIVDGVPSGLELVIDAGTGKHGRGERRVSIRRK